MEIPPVQGMISISRGGNVVSMEFSVRCEGRSGNSWRVGGGRDPDFALPPGYSLLPARPWVLGSFHPGDALALRLGRVPGRQRSEQDVTRGEHLLSGHCPGCGLSTLLVYELTFHRAPNSGYGGPFVRSSHPGLATSLGDRLVVVLVVARGATSLFFSFILLI